MLAAARGHTLVMKILLDNHASVNDTDKMKVVELFKHKFDFRICVTIYETKILNFSSFHRHKP